MSWDSRSDGEQNDILQLSDSELVERLRDYGADPGPIVATTRRVYEKKLMKLMVGISEDFENCNETEDFEAEANSDSDDGGELDIQDQRRGFAEGKEILTKSELAMKSPKGSLLAEDAVARQRRCNSVPPRLKPDEDEVTSNSTTKDPWCFPTKSLRRSDYLRRSQDWLKADLDKAAAVLLASSPPQVAVLPLPHPKITQRGSPFHQDPMQQKKLPSPSNFSPASDEFDYGPLDTTVLQAPLIEKAASPKSITFAVKKARNEKCLELPKRPEREFDLYRSPTGISATRRPPIRGAAHGNYASPLLSQRVTEMYARPRLTHRELPRANAAPLAKRRSVPIWVRVIIAVTLLIFILLVYGAMEENFEMPLEILGSKGDKHLDNA